MKNLSNSCVRALICSQLFLSCGTRDSPSRTLKQVDGRTVDAEGRSVELKNFSDESVVETALISFKKDASVSLADDEAWTVEIEARKDVTSSVAEQKYLRVTGTLKPATVEGASELGCLQIELKDNVNYREQGWLRIATNGIVGDKFAEVMAPIYIEREGWTVLPILNHSVTLGKFPVNTVKKFDGTVCFKIDTKDLPAQSYKGQVVVQYLKSGAREDQSPELNNFACAQEPIAINAGQQTKVSFKLPRGIASLSYAVRSNPQMIDAGTVTSDGVSSAVFKAPVNPATSFKAMIQARPSNTEYMPVFCEVHVVAKTDIGIGDDGEIQALTGNVYRLPVNTAKLPDFSKLPPISQIAAANLDIPDRDFMSGFPGVKDLVEWFGIQFRGTLRVPAECSSCKFKISSDDGSKLFIDNVLVIDNDGIHPTIAREGQKSLSAGDHQIRVDYYQGPRVRISLQLFWDLGDGNGYKIIPSNAFSRPLN